MFRHAGVATSRSLFVATPPLILTLLDEESYHGRERIYAFPTRDFACLRLAPDCGAEAGVFLISLKKFAFFKRLLDLEF
jgi:hypothetical protein